MGVLLADGADGGGGREHGGGPVFRQDAEEGPGVRRPDGLALQHSQRADSCLSPTSPSRGTALNLRSTPRPRFHNMHRAPVQKAAFQTDGLEPTDQNTQ